LYILLRKGAGTADAAAGPKETEKILLTAKQGSEELL
jgi:hypothetical protein